MNEPPKSKQNAGLTDVKGDFKANSQRIFTMSEKPPSRSKAPSAAAKPPPDPAPAAAWSPAVEVIIHIAAIHSNLLNNPFKSCIIKKQEAKGGDIVGAKGYYRENTGILQ